MDGALDRSAAQIDALQAQRFLRALAGDAPIVFQCVDDAKKDRPGLTEHKAGTLLSLFGYLRAQNQRGAAIFFQVNAGGRGDTYVHSPRALVIDDDLTAETRPDLRALPPSAIVRSSTTPDGRTKMHYYWFLKEGEPLEAWLPAMQHLARALHTDEAICKLSLVMRLPGFMHCKGAPQRTELLACHATRRFSITEVIAAFPLTNGVKKPNGTNGTNGATARHAIIDQALAGALPDPEPTKGADGRDPDDAPHTDASKATFQRICDWLKRIGEPFVVRESHPRFIYLTKGCPRNREHRDAVIIAGTRGGIIAKCFHDSCFDDKTEVLTREGFIPFVEVTDDTEIATRGKDGCIEYHRPIARQRFKYKGKLLHFRSRSVDMCVTPDHALYCASHDKTFRRVVAEDTKKKRGWSLIYFSRHAGWIGREQATYEIPTTRGADGRNLSRRNSVSSTPMDAWLALLGWYIAEGSYSKTARNYTVVITQKSRRTRREIIDIARRAGFHARHNDKNVRICSKQLYEYVQAFGHAADKYIPQELLQLSQRQLRILFDALMAGDGNQDGKRYTTISRRLADNVQEIALKLGLGASILNNERTRTGKILYRVIFGKPRLQIKQPHIREVDYDGEVFDVTVPNHVLMVRRHGRIAWSGNCGTVRKNSWLDFRTILGGWAELRRGDHVELAIRLRNELRAEYKSDIITESGHRLATAYRYDEGSGAWLPIPDETLECHIMSYAGITYGEQSRAKKLNDSDIPGILRRAKVYCAQPGFFEQAPAGALFTNGFLVIRGTQLVLLPHAPEHHARGSFPYTYNPDATAPRWLQFLHEIFVDDPDAEDKITFLQEFFGACVLGVATRYQLSVFLTGRGANGKSLMLRVLQALFPPTLVSAVRPQDMDSEYSRALLQNKRINIVTELPDRELLSVAGFNAMIDGSLINGRPIREAPVSFMPTAAHVFACNRLPAFRDLSRGFSRRAAVITFNREFAVQEQDRFLADRIVATELEGICNWCLIGGARLLKKGHYSAVPSSAEMQQIWLAQNNPVTLWLEEETEPAQPEGDAIPTGATTEELFQSFKLWADENKYVCMSKVQFALRLEAARLSHTRRRVGGKARTIWAVRLLQSYNLQS